MSIAEQVQRPCAWPRSAGRATAWIRTSFSGTAAAERAELIAGMRPSIASPTIWCASWRACSSEPATSTSIGLHPGPLLWPATTSPTWIRRWPAARSRELSYVAKRELFRFKPFGALIHTSTPCPSRAHLRSRVLRRIARAGARRRAVLFFRKARASRWGAWARPSSASAWSPRRPWRGAAVFISGRPSLGLPPARERLEIAWPPSAHRAPGRAGLQGRELLEQFGEGVMPRSSACRPNRRPRSRSGPAGRRAALTGTAAGGPLIFRRISLLSSSCPAAAGSLLSDTRQGGDSAWTSNLNPEGPGHGQASPESTWKGVRVRARRRSGPGRGGPSKAMMLNRKLGLELEDLALARSSAVRGGLRGADAAI